MKKLSKLSIYFISVSVVVFIALVFVIISTSVSFVQTKDAINNIGVVAYNEKSKSQINDAQAKYETFEKGLGASITFASVEEKVGVEELTKAKAKYVEAAIRDVNTKYINGAQESDVQKELSEIRKTLDSYFANGDFSKISNYSTLTSLEAKYTSQSNASSSGNSQEGSQEIEIC